MGELVELAVKLTDASILLFIIVFIALFGFGALLLATAATGGWSQYHVTVSEPLWRDIIAGAGAALLGAAIIFAFLQPMTYATLPSRKHAGVSMDQPKDGERVRIPFLITGRYKALPKGFQLWLFNIAGQGKGLRYWPHEEIRIDADKNWRTELRATNFKDGDKRRLAIFLVGEGGQALIHHYRTVGEAINNIEPKDDRRHWPAITILPPDIVQATDRIEVTLSNA